MQGYMSQFRGVNHQVQISASIAPVPLFSITTRSREVSKPRVSGLDFSSRSTIWQALRLSAYEMPVKFQSGTIIITPNLSASRLHEILW